MIRGGAHTAKMSVAAPPTPRRVPPPPPPRPLRRRNLFRVAGFGLLGAAILGLILYAVLSGPATYEYKLYFQTAELLVNGNPVEVGGVPVGSVQQIIYRKRLNQAEVVISVAAPVGPLHEGTKAEIRYPSLSGVANRYISLEPGPNNYPVLRSGAAIPVTETKSPTDLDELFDTLNPPTRHGLQQLIEGFAELYAGNEGNVNTTTHYFAPSLAALSHVFAELTRDEKTFTAFLLNAAEATSIIGAHSEALRDLIGHAARTFEAIASEQESLKRGLEALPGALEAGTATFNELPGPLAAFRHLVDVSKPDTKELPVLLERLRPLLAEATPVVENLAASIRNPSNHDFLQGALELPELASVLEKASPDTVKAERQSLPNTAFFGPYAPDLVGLLRDFGIDTGYYDANGHYAHVLPVFGDFKYNEATNTLTPSTPTAGLEGLVVGQLRRCPGAAAPPPHDHSAPFTDNGLLGCIASEVP